MTRLRILRWLFAAGLSLGFFATSYALDYNVPGQVQHFGRIGWLIDSGSDHWIAYKAYLETRQLL